jgi:ABC-type transport system substrate-binding protein
VEEKPVYGGRLRERTERDPVSWDAQTATSSLDNKHNAKVNVNLWWNPRGREIENDVLESYELEDGGKTYVLHLKRGVLFHDGRELLAEDVQYSLEKIMGLIDGIISARTGWIKEYIDTIEVVDDYTLKLHMIRPWGGLPQVMSTGFAAMYKKGTTREELKTAPKGAGAWLLKDWVRGSYTLFERNPKYHRKGYPYLDEFQNIMIRDTAAAQAAFMTGRVDIETDERITRDNWPLFRKLEKEGKITIHPFLTNCIPQGVNFNSTVPPFDNLKLRQAVNLLIDRTAYIETVHEGLAEPQLILPTGGPFSRTPDEIWDKFPGFARGERKAAEIEQAKKLMAEAGYPDGLDVEMTVRDLPGYIAQAEFIAGELLKIGIRTKMTIMSSAELFPRVTKLNYKIWPYWFCQTTLEPDELWAGYYITGGSRNWLGYSDPWIDEMFVKQSAELDFEKRKALNLQMEDHVLEFLPLAPLANHYYQKYWWWYVKGFEPGISWYTEQRMESVWDLRRAK